MAETTITIIIKTDSSGTTVSQDQSSSPARIALSASSQRTVKMGHLAGSVDDEPGGHDPSQGFPP